MLMLLNYAIAQTNCGGGPGGCAAQTDCASCLSLPSSGVRCGCTWCHTDVTLSGGTKGPRCIDPGSERSSKCDSELDLYQCTAGYICNPQAGQCSQAPPGEGTSKAACELSCNRTPTKTADAPPLQCGVASAVFGTNPAAAATAVETGKLAFWSVAVPSPSLLSLHPSQLFIYHLHMKIHHH